MAHFDRFDICAAWNLHLQGQVNGQGSVAYKRLCKLQSYFTPSYGEEKLTGLSDNALEIYAGLQGDKETPEYPITGSPDETLFCMWAGAYQDTKVYVFADSFESAFDEFTEWLDENAPGHLVSEEEFQDLLNEASKEHGFESWADAESQWKAKNGEWAGWHNDMMNEYQAIIEQAESDLTLIGHTTLKHGSYITSYEWGGDEVTDSDEYEAVYLASRLNGVES